MRRDMENVEKWTDTELNDTWEALAAEISQRRQENGEVQGGIGEVFEQVSAEYTRRHPLEGFQVSYRR